MIESDAVRAPAKNVQTVRDNWGEAKRSGVVPNLDSEAVDPEIPPPTIDDVRHYSLWHSFKKLVVLWFIASRAELYATAAQWDLVLTFESQDEQRNSRSLKQI